MSKTRNNHYVPQWYQRRFLFNEVTDQVRYLDQSPEKVTLPNGILKTLNELRWRPPSKSFFERDLYTTFFGSYINDEIETYLFGAIDTSGARALRAFTQDDIAEWHNNFDKFFLYIDAQKLRTPKGLQWIKEHYPDLGQLDLMIEMQALRNMHCKIWSEGVREIVSAKSSETKFIVSDHPVTIYNHACPPQSDQCKFPNDPSIALKGSQTIFPLDMNHCLILTNYEYAKNPDTQNPLENRTHARNFGKTLVRTDAFIKSRNLNEDEVKKINFILKQRARRYLGAAKEEWLFPERDISSDWSALGEVLLPPKNELWHFGGETYVGYKDGSSYYQDAFGRTQPENKHLQKPKRDKEPGPNDQCGCGGAKKYKKCCMQKTSSERPTWEVLGIRERNIIFANGIEKILGLSKGKTWEDVRRELSDSQVKEIHELYGFLWPLETDIVSLLPKPDNVLRAIYSGIIDPRVINFVLGLTSYFDEIIIQNPFMNPWSIKPEYSPIESPHQYKLETLKNVSLFLLLMPFVDAGYINLIPDPGTFDGHLRDQMFNLAKERTGSLVLGGKEKRKMEWFHKDDFNRSLFLLPEKQQRHQITKALPHLTEVEIVKLLKHFEEKKISDPYSLMQDDVYDKGGQLQMYNLTPNFELAMYLAQITGSIFLTDSDYRWEEMIKAQRKTNGAVTYNYSILSDAISKGEYYWSPDIRDSFNLRWTGKLNQIRRGLSDVAIEIQTQAETQKKRLKKLSRQFVDAHVAASKEFNREIKIGAKCKLTCLIPKGGFVHNNVHRMLLSSGVHNFMKNVPIAIFAEPENSTTGEDIAS